MSGRRLVASHPLDVVGEGIITVTKAPNPSVRIKPGETVTVGGHTGVWRVTAFHRGGADLESMRSLTRQTLRGIDYSRLKRVTR